MIPSVFVHLDYQHSQTQDEERLCDFSAYGAVRVSVEVEGDTPVILDLHETVLDQPGTMYHRFRLGGRSSRTITIKAWGEDGEYAEESTTCVLQAALPETLIGTFQVYSNGRMVKI